MIINLEEQGDLTTTAPQELFAGWHVAFTDHNINCQRISKKLIIKRTLKHILYCSFILLSYYCMYKSSFIHTQF